MHVCATQSQRETQIRLRLINAGHPRSPHGVSAPLRFGCIGLSLRSERLTGLPPRASTHHWTPGVTTAHPLRSAPRIRCTLRLIRGPLVVMGGCRRGRKVLTVHGTAPGGAGYGKRRQKGREGRERWHHTSALGVPEYLACVSTRARRSDVGRRPAESPVTPLAEPRPLSGRPVMCDRAWLSRAGGRGARRAHR